MCQVSGKVTCKVHLILVERGHFALMFCCGGHLSCFHSVHLNKCLWIYYTAESEDFIFSPPIGTMESQRSQMSSTNKECMRQRKLTKETWTSQVVSLFFSGCANYCLLDDFSHASVNMYQYDQLPRHLAVEG